MMDEDGESEREVTQPGTDPAAGRSVSRHRAILLWGGSATPEGGGSSRRMWELGETIEIGRNLDNSTGSDWISLDDALISRHHAQLRSVGGGVTIRDLGSLNGTFVDGVRVQAEKILRSGSVISIGQQILILRFCTHEQVAALRREIADPLGPTGTLSPAMAVLMRKLRRLAGSAIDLLLTGETGVGKEVIAEAIHHASGRKGPFVAINCAALPDNLLESELFGYARGAHTTAAQEKPGLLQKAIGGTLFVDEIGEMASSAQAKLLRFLQGRSFTPLGSTRSLSVDVRILAATNRRLGTGTSLRADLRARLGTESLVVPPLRDRIEDVGTLTAHFMADRPHRFFPDAFHSLFLYRWPANVRELEKVVTLASVLAGSLPVSLSHLPGIFAAQLAGKNVDGSLQPDVRAWRPSPTVDELKRLLEQHGGDVARVARKLGRQRTLVWRWLRKKGVDPRVFRRADGAGNPSR